jgi:preprotein translocase subunit YajC
VEKINGKSLMLIAYAIIFGVFVLYTASILRREKAVEKEAQQLKNQLGETP